MWVGWMSQIISMQEETHQFRILYWLFQSQRFEFWGKDEGGAPPLKPLEILGPRDDNPNRPSLNTSESLGLGTPKFQLTRIWREMQYTCLSF